MPVCSQFFNSILRCKSEYSLYKNTFFFFYFLTAYPELCSGIWEKDNTVYPEHSITLKALAPARKLHKWELNILYLQLSLQRPVWTHAGSVQGKEEDLWSSSCPCIPFCSYYSPALSISEHTCTFTTVTHGGGGIFIIPINLLI